MNTTSALSRRATLGRSFFVAVALTLSFALNLASAAPQPVADAKGPLPVTVAFEKVTGETGPYVMTVTNTSSGALTVKVTVHQSVQSHNNPKDVEHPPVTIAAGKSTTVNELAVHDKVKITAEGYAPVEAVVTPAKN